MLLPETLRVHDRSTFEFHYIYFLPWKNQMVDSLLNHGGKVVCFSASNNIQLILKANHIAKYVRDNDIKLIHAHLPWAGVVARLVGKLTGVPVLYTEHNKQERYHFVTRWLNLLTMDWLSGLIAVSNDVKDSVLKYKPSLDIPLYTILNGVNLTHFAPEQFSGSDVRSEFGIPMDAPLIGTIAVFRFQKRLDLWLELALKILAKIPEAHFLIVGDGPLKQELLNKVQQLKLSQVHFAGLQTEVRPYLAAMDVYMMSSIFEGLPIALLEAMASERAIVTTDAGGIKEVIRHQHDGLICKVDEPELLVSYVVQLINNTAERHHYGRQARERIKALFSMEKMVRELEALYKQELKHKV